ncbi:MAG TPA: acyl-CoA thioester hydrolase/BAAT C-terminal domain-containing protein [Thermoleophilaceae bacterium]|nr:acyl-CoA thioester hydrolase/BAAT C-terminal domain-containing protein [Thermoleophilaceae bacterium]
MRHEILVRFARHPRPKALHMRPAYEPSLRDRDAVTQASIPVERIGCPLLLVSGDADETWPASEMSESIVERRRSHGVRSADRQLRFADAGYFLRPPITPTTIPWSAELVSGETAEGNAHARAAAWAARLEFLAAHSAHHQTEQRNASPVTAWGGRGDASARAPRARCPSRHGTTDLA